MRPIPNYSQDGGETAENRERRTGRQGEAVRQRETRLLRREQKRDDLEKERANLDDDELWIAVQEF